MNVVVTGGSGFIGSNLALALEKRGDKVTVIDDFSAARFQNLLTFKGNVIAQDINEVRWEKLGKVDAIFHQAALTDTTVSDQKRMMTSNVEGFRKILSFVVNSGVQLTYASSAAVYGNNPAPQTYTDQPNPLNIYGYSKLVADKLAMEAAKESHKTIVGLRYFNVFGMGEQGKGSYASMIFQLAEQIRKGKQPRIFTDGNQSRDHIYVKDVVKANFLANEAKDSCIVNIGTGISTTFNQLIAILNDVLGTDQAPDYFDNPYAFYQNETRASVEHTEASIGFKAEYPLAIGVQEYLQTLYELKGQLT